MSNSTSNPSFIAAFKKQIGHLEMHPVMLSSEVSTHERGTEGYSQDWIDKGRPQCWMLVEKTEDGKYEAWVDVGHGHVALYSTQDDYVAYGKDTAYLDDGKVMVMNIDYFGLPRYIYREYPETNIAGLLETVNEQQHKADNASSQSLTLVRTAADVENLKQTLPRESILDMDTYMGGVFDTIRWLTDASSPLPEAFEVDDEDEEEEAE